jgi:Zn-dependent protease with chaperone function
MAGVGATWFNAGSGQKHGATFTIDAAGFAEASAADGAIRKRAPIKDVEVSPRLANTPRRIVFPGGGLAVVEDNDYIDRALKAAGKKGGLRAHFWETRLILIPLLLLSAAAIAVGVINYGLPAAARAIANAVPPQTIAKIGDDFYEEMTSRRWILPTTLDDDTVAKARALFDNVAADVGGDEFDYRFYVHDLQIDEQSVANAFALPSGIVIATDRLLEIAEDDEQLIVVFAHEVGHIRARHSFRQIIQGASTAILVGLIFGDVGGVIAAPILLAHLKYSRDLEREADCFAYRYLQTRQIRWSRFGEVLSLMEADFMREANGGEENTEDGEEHAADKKSEEDGDKAAEAIVEYLSSHPHTAARADPAAHCQ